MVYQYVVTLLPPPLPQRLLAEAQRVPSPK